MEDVTERLTEQYIGDGVYASFDGWYVWLRAPREHGNHMVALEPDVFKHLAEYCQIAWAHIPGVKISVKS
jgi:hypothetical protein